MNTKEFTAKTLRRLLLGWLLAATVEALLVRPDLAGVADLAKMNLLRLLLLTGGIAAALFFSKWEAFERWGLPGAFAALAAVSLKDNFRPSFLQACLLIFALLVVYAWLGWDSSAKNRPQVPETPIAKSKKQRKRDEEKLQRQRMTERIITIVCAALTGVLALGFVWYISAWTVGRVNIFWTPTYDFGIFSQMFYSMANHGTPVTTLEREVGALSHFAVHVSPSYYLMLPFYMLFPQPATLQVLQAVILASAVIPLWLIGKHHGLSAPVRLLLCAVLLVYPAFGGGTYYDMHENCMLTPAILWLFYAIDKKKIWLIALAAIITLGIKEDAAVYVAVVALYVLLRALLHDDTQDAITGAALLGASLLWFFAVTYYLATHGDGVMTYRYDNFMCDGKSSLISVIKTVLMSPMKAVFECVDPEKLDYIRFTMLSLFCLPLVTRRYERLVLLIPYILINLMSDYQYQHSILFQYNFGATACLIYMVAVNVADMKWEHLRAGVLAAAAVLGLSTFCAQVKPVADTCIRTDEQYSAYYDGVRNTLDTVPDGATVTATTFYTTYLSQRDVIYDLNYATREQMLSTEFVVLELSREGDAKKYGGMQGLIALLEKEGYSLYTQYGSAISIYRRSN